MAKSAAAKEKEELIEKREEYKDFMDGRNCWILKELALKHNIKKPGMDQLREIAHAVHISIDRPLGRQEKRHKDLLLVWFNMHRTLIEPCLQDLVILDDGKTTGPKAEQFDRFYSENPTAESVRYLKGEIDGNKRRKV
jgi:hypothetical protein